MYVILGRLWALAGVVGWTTDIPIPVFSIASLSLLANRRRIGITIASLALLEKDWNNYCVTSVTREGLE